MRLVLMGDFHYPRMVHVTQEILEARDYFYQGMLKKFLELDGDYHIALGDLTNEGAPEELSFVFDYVERLGADRNFIHVLGNHDAYSIPKADIRAITGQNRYYGLEKEEAMLLFLDTTKEMNREDWGGELDPEQLQWLEHMVHQSGSKPLFVFAHHPVYETTSRSTLDKMCIHPGIDMRAILNREEGAGFYFNGHNHCNSIVRNGHWHYVQAAACLDVPAFWVVEIKGDDVKVNLHPVADNELLNRAKLVAAHMNYYRPLEGAEGSESDRSLSFNCKEALKLKA